MKKKIVFLFLAGGSEAHFQNLAVQKKLFLKHTQENMKFFWMLSSSKIHTIELEDSILRIPVQDKYSNLLEKTRLGIEWVMQNENPDILIRSNTSNFFDFRYLQCVRDSIPTNQEFYGGFTAPSPWEYTERFGEKFDYVSGSGIFLSRNSAKLLINIDVNYYSGVVEDVAIGHFFAKKLIKTTFINRWNLTDWQPYVNTFQIRVKSWNSDKVTVKRFKTLSRIQNSYFLWKAILKFIFKLSEFFRAVGQRELVRAVKFLTSSFEKF